MTQMIFLNLPSTDIARARAFYAGLGFSLDERFCNADTLMVTVSDAIHLMILDRDRFASFSPRPLAPEGTLSAHVNLSRPSAEAVDDFVERALAHGGTDNGDRHRMGDYMYGHSVLDPDGNGIAVTWMDVDKAMQAGGIAV
jgi:predicted lactoylglutathione lyase